MPEDHHGDARRARPTPERRADYARFERITTRWSDNDSYRHVNNVVYYSFFDTAVNRMLIEAGLLDIERSEVIGLVVETRCHFFKPVSFPDEVWAGLRVAHLGRSSIRYEIGLFRQEEDLASAQGSFTQVVVDRATNRPVDMPAPRRAFLQGMMRVRYRTDGSPVG